MDPVNVYSGRFFAPPSQYSEVWATEAVKMSFRCLQCSFRSKIHIARHFGERRRNSVGQHFWARGYFVSTVGRDETVIRRYIRHQEVEEQRQDQLDFG